MTSALCAFLLLQGFAFSSLPVPAASLPGQPAGSAFSAGTDEPVSEPGRPFLRFPKSLPVGELSGIEIPELPEKFGGDDQRGASQKARVPLFPELNAVPGRSEAGGEAATQPRFPENTSQRGSDFRVAELVRKDAGRKQWWALAIAQHSAAAFDAWSTRRVVSNGWGRETNPLLRPFAGSGALYAAIQVGPAIQDYLGHKMRTSSNPVLRKLWWLPQLAGTAIHVWSGVHNLGVARRAQRNGF
jgi:hypothetical protein